MTSPYTPTPEFTDSQLVVADGDAADHNAFNLGPEKAFDRLAMLRAATDGLLVWSGRARVDAGGSASASFKVYCPAIEAVELLNGTTWGAYALASETELTSAFHFASGTLANSTVYYVYAYVSAGVLALQVSTDAPAADGIWKTSATGTHRYLFSLATDSSGVPLPMRRTSGGQYTYRLSSSGTSLRVLNGTTSATSFTDVPCAAFIPPHAKVGKFYASVLNADAVNWGKTSFRTDGDTGYQIEVPSPPAGASQDSYASLEFELELGPSQVIEYKRDSASSAADVDVFLFVTGFSE